MRLIVSVGCLPIFVRQEIFKFRCSSVNAFAHPAVLSCFLQYRVRLVDFDYWLAVMFFILSFITLCARFSLVYLPLLQLRLRRRMNSKNRNSRGVEASVEPSAKGPSKVAAVKAKNDLVMKCNNCSAVVKRWPCMERNIDKKRRLESAIATTTFQSPHGNPFSSTIIT